MFSPSPRTHPTRAHRREILRFWSIEPYDSSEIFHNAFFLVSNKARKEQLQIDLKPDCSSLGKVIASTLETPYKTFITVNLYIFFPPAGSWITLLSTTTPSYTKRKKKESEKRKKIGENKISSWWIYKNKLGGMFYCYSYRKRSPHLSFFRFPTIIKTHSFPGYLHRFFPSLNKFLILNGQTDQQREINSFDCADTL